MATSLWLSAWCLAMLGLLIGLFEPFSIDGHRDNGGTCLQKVTSELWREQTSSYVQLFDASKAQPLELPRVDHLLCIFSYLYLPLFFPSVFLPSVLVFPSDLLDSFTGSMLKSEARKLLTLPWAA